MGVSANELPKDFTAKSFAAAIASFIAAALCWFLYFAASPASFEKLPDRKPAGSYKQRIFKMGDVLCTVLYCYAHVGLAACLPLLASGFARLVEKPEDRDQETKLLVCISAGAFMVFSGLVLSFGSDGEVLPGKVPPRMMNPSQRAMVRSMIGIVLGLVSGLSCLMVEEEVWPIEIWGGVVCLAFALSAHLETRPSDLREVPLLRSQTQSVGLEDEVNLLETGTSSSNITKASKRLSSKSSVVSGGRSSQATESSIELHSRSQSLEGDPTFFGDCNPMRLTGTPSISSLSNGDTDI